MFNYHYQTKEATHKGHGESVDQLCWHPSNPDLLVTASGDKTIRIWDARGKIDCSSDVFYKKRMNLLINRDLVFWILCTRKPLLY